MRNRTLVCLCFISAVATATASAIPPRDWSRPTGSAHDACVATNGDVFLVGSVAGTVDFGDTSVTSAGAVDVVVSRYDEDGNTVWVRSAGWGGGTQPYHRGGGIAPSPDGGCLVTGVFSETIEFDDQYSLSTAALDVFVARYAPDGSVLWVTSYGSPEAETMVGAAADASGGCYTLSTYFGMEAHVLLARHDAAGALQWQLDAANAIAEAIGSDPAGNVLISGYFDSSMTLGDSTLSTGPGNFLASVSEGGNVLWLREFAAGVCASDIVTDESGAIYVSGSFLYNADIGDTTLVPNSLYFDGFLARHDAGGNFEWAREIDSAGLGDEAEFRGLAVTPGGNVVVAARFFQSAILSGDTLQQSDGHEGGLVAEWTPDGTLVDYVSSGSNGGPGNQRRPIAVNANGTVYRWSVDDTLSGPNLVGHRGVASGIRAPSTATSARLLPNHPNPFNPTTTIPFRLEAAANVELVIFSVAGRRVREILSGPTPAGLHEEVWDGTDDHGRAVASGVYVARLRAGGATASRKLVLIK